MAEQVYSVYCLTSPKAKIAAASRRQVSSPETRAKISAARKRIAAEKRGELCLR